ncbi:MAG: AMP-binding protein [Patescibacteria group bacterium]|nr:AMP-binding protein [Patescibacteria group bacterium]MDD5715577.1 AMP-binding protein [Patescibacteria group bacterium]
MKWTELSQLPAAELLERQNRRLAYFMQHELPYSPYYRRLFEENNIRFGDIRTTDDLQRIPFTTKADIAPTADDPARTRQFILQPDEQLIKQYASKQKLAQILWGKLTKQDVKRALEYEYKPVHLHFTTGRTALPTPFAYTATDVATLQEGGARMLDVAGVSRDLFALNAFPYAPHLAFWQVYNGFLKLGMTSLQTGGGKIMGTQKIIDAIERLKIGIIAFIPGYGYHLIREAVKQKKDFSNLKFVISGGERASAGMKEKVKKLLVEVGAKDVQFLSTYAFTEAKIAWIQCHELSGYHLYPDIEYFEVIDKNGKRVGPGEPGELVYTSLGWHGTIVVRYRTGDMTEGIDYEPCPHCGKTVPRIRMDIQRTSEIKEFRLTKVKGELINLNNFYPVLSSIPEIEEWQVEIRKRNDDPYDIDEIFLHVALKEGVSMGEMKHRIQRAVHSELFINVDIHEQKLEKILQMLGMETEVKEKRIIDNRPKD